jgi:phosphoglycolate phosphatase
MEIAPASPPKPVYRLVIFDFDGTLADTFPWFATVVNPTADRFRFRRAVPEETHFMRGLDARELLEYLAIARWKVPLIARHLRKRAEREKDTFRLFPGAEAIVAALDEAGVKVAVVSSNGEETVRHVLGPDISGRVDQFACGAALFGKARKFARVLAQQGVTPREALCIGDETRDITAARRAGIACAAVSWGYMRRDVLEAARPDHLFDAMEEIPAAVLRALAGPPAAAGAAHRMG